MAVCAAALDAWISVDTTDHIGMACAAVACAALVVRRRLPYLVFALTLPAVVASMAVIASLVALYTLSSRTRNRPALIACTVLAVIGYALPWPTSEFDLTSPDT